MAKICMAGAGSVIETAEYIKKEMLERGGISPELKDEVSHIQDGVGIDLIVFERYYMRNGSYASLSVAITGDDGAVYVDGIGAGGGGGIFNISWGSETDFTDLLAEILEERGFKALAEEEH